MLSLPDTGERHLWRLERGKQAHELGFVPRLVADDMFALRHVALQGLGVALLPEILCRDELREGRLVRLFPDWACTASEIQAAFATRRGMLPAVRAFIDHLLAHPPGAPQPGAGLS